MLFSIKYRLKNIGPGAVVAAAFIGPGTVTTATLAGASHGYTLLWAVVFSVIATVILQEMSARLGAVAGIGVGEALRQKIKHKTLFVLAGTLVVGAIFIGNAAYEAGNITGAVMGFKKTVVPVMGLSLDPWVCLTGLVAFLLLFSGKYKTIERALVVMVCLLGVVFLLSAILLKPDYGAILRGMFIPALPGQSLLMVVGLIGTTVVPYNLFLHAAAVREKWPGEENLSISRWDTYLSVILGGIITIAILVTAAVAFQSQDKEIKGAADLAEQLVPLLGGWSPSFIAVGFLAAGLSSAITAPLAAAFATSEIMGWEKNLRGTGFRLVWLSVLVVGVVLSSMGFKPVQLILFAQVANGLLLPIVAAFLVWIMNDGSLVGRHNNSLWGNALGILVILIALGLGAKGILAGWKVF